MSRYFTPEEFRCKCGRPECDAPQPSPALFEMLDKVRGDVGQPLPVNSGCRCPYWNAREGGVKGSEHETGEGADLGCTDAGLRYKVLAAAILRGVKRIGVGKTFVHLGVSKTRDQQVVWHYYKD